MPGNRKSNRLKNYDYTREGAYYVTVCVNEHKCIFGDVRNGEIMLNKCGKIADKCWNEISEHFPHVALDEHIVMPNHVHGIIIVRAKDFSALPNDNLNNGVRAKDVSPVRNDNRSPLRNDNRSPLPKGTSNTIGSVIRGFKVGVTKWIRQNTNIKNVWQRNFYEHIIRDENDLNRIREYIINNPFRWKEDEYYGT